MKRGDLQKLLHEYGEHYVAYSSLGPNPPDPLLHKEHALARIIEYDALKGIETLIWAATQPVGSLEAGGEHVQRAR